MEAAKVVQRIGVILAHTLLSEARRPIGVSYESDQGVDMDYTLCSAFYIHMTDLQNLVNMKVDLWIAVVYRLNEGGEQDLGFAITHNKVPACELRLYPFPSINYAAEVTKKFMAFSLLPYYDLDGLAQKANLANLSEKYGNADGWGDTVTVQLRAEDFPYDVDYTGGIFRGFSERMLEGMKQDVAMALGSGEELRHRVFSLENDIGVVFVPESTYLASRSVPKEL
jgi:hypothetical protein